MSIANLNNPSKNILISIALSFLFISGCANRQYYQHQVSDEPQRPIVKIGKIDGQETCRISISVFNRFPFDVEGNYVDIVLLDKTGQIIDRKKGYFHDYIFQSKNSNGIIYPTKVSCNDISGIKIYSLSFAMPGGRTFRGNDIYELKLVGF